MKLLGSAPTESSSRALVSSKLALSAAGLALLLPTAIPRSAPASASPPACSTRHARDWLSAFRRSDGGSTAAARPGPRNRHDFGRFLPAARTPQPLLQ